MRKFLTISFLALAILSFGQAPDTVVVIGSGINNLGGDSRKAAYGKFNTWDAYLDARADTNALDIDTLQTDVATNAAGIATNALDIDTLQNNFEIDSLTIETHNGALYAVAHFGGDTLGFYFPDAYSESGALTINVQTDASYTALLSDRNTAVIYMNNAGANTVSLPTVATSGWEVGDHITVLMLGAGVTSIDPAVGVNINGANDDVAISEQYGVLQFIMRTTNEWNIFGTK